MGKLLDMLPQIEAEIRTRDILEWLGCVRLGCTVVVQDDVVKFGRWVRHNGETMFFEHTAERQLVPVFRSNDILVGPVAHISSAIAAWITDQHPAIEAKREEERQSAIDADPWRQHAEMVAGVR